MPTTFDNQTPRLKDFLRRSRTPAGFFGLGNAPGFETIPNAEGTEFTMLEVSSLDVRLVLNEAVRG
jgi:hypothetical protein